MNRSFFVPEVVRGTARETGAATLEAIFKGLRTGVKRAQIQVLIPSDARVRVTMKFLADVAQKLGMAVEPQMIPFDHLFNEEADLPAIVLANQSAGQSHFIVVWQQNGPFIQVMDPLNGRQWMHLDALLNQFTVQEETISAAEWRTWAASPKFLTPLRLRLAKLQVPESEIERLLADALEDLSWHALATLDAATRSVDAAVRNHLLKNESQAPKMLAQILQRTEQYQGQSYPSQSENTGSGGLSYKQIPAAYWSVLPADAQPDQEETLAMRGVAVLRVEAWTEPEATADIPEETPPDMHTAQSAEEQVEALEAQTGATQQRLWEALRIDGLFAPVVLASAATIAAIGLIFEALLLQSLLQMGQFLNLPSQRIGAVLVLLLFFVLFLLTDSYTIRMGLQMGLRLEARLRIAFLERIPYLSSQYFSSRPIADLVQRAFSIRSLQQLPERGLELLQRVARFLFTALGIIWLEPTNLWIILLSIAIYVGSLYMLLPVLNKRGLRTGVASNNLRRYPLDALLGLIPLRTHGAERALQRVHEGNLVEWSRAFLAQTGTGAMTQTYIAFVYSMITALILYNYIAQGGQIQNILLLTYWSMGLPELIREMTTSAMVYLSMVGTSSMLYEPLTAPTEFPEEETLGATSDAAELATLQSNSGPISITMKSITLQLGGKTVLKDLDLEISSGQHVGIVGPSGAGKSTLVGLLLGWYAPSAGQIWIDDQLLNGRVIKELRQQTAWVDPGIQIWNRSFMDNLVYGTEFVDAPPLGPVIEQADLLSVLERLPDGVQAPLGEAGGLISGGEGQRVRFGRAMLRKDVKLVILDEPFRGLDRAKRGQLLQKAREYWQDATLICVTHDVDEIQTFERVLVVEAGHIAEDATPQELTQQAHSRYKDLLEAEEAVRGKLWSATDWRRLWMDSGILEERT